MPQRRKCLRVNINYQWGRSDPTMKPEESPVANSPLANLPFELKADIAAYLPKRDLKNLRLVSSAFNGAARPHLAKSLAIPLVTEFATWLKENPSIAQGVKKVSHLPIALQMPRPLGNKNHRFNWWCIFWDEINGDKKSTRYKMLTHNGRMDLDPTWTSSGPSDPRNRASDPREWYYRNFRAYEKSQAAVLDDQLAWFTQVFLLLPRVTEIEFPDIRQLLAPKPSGVRKVMRDTLCNADFNKWRALMIQRRLGNMNIDEAYSYQIRYMLIGAADASLEIQRLDVGIVPWNFFKGSPLQGRFHAALKNIRHLSFSLTCGTYNHGVWKNKKEMRGLAQMIAAPDSLKSLDINAGGLASEIEPQENNITLSDLVSVRTRFPRLRSLKLQSVESRQDVLLKFLDEHASTLRELEFNNITVTPTYPVEVTVVPRYLCGEVESRIEMESASWVAVLKHLRNNLDLEHFEVNYALAIGCDYFWRMDPLMRADFPDERSADQAAGIPYQKIMQKTPCTDGGEHVTCMKARIQDYVLRRGGNWMPGAKGSEVDEFGESDGCWKFELGNRMLSELIAEFLDFFAQLDLETEDEESELSREMMATFLKDLERLRI